MESKVLFIGMHDSGKTTFIACLWDYINSSKPDKTLKLHTLGNTENEYLEKIRSEWLRFEKVTRTYMVNNTEKVIMKAEIVSTRNKLSLEIPDISGELFNSHFHVREWSPDFEVIFTDLNGIVLFINPTDKKNRTQFIIDANKIENDIGSGVADKTQTETNDETVPKTPVEVKEGDENRVEFASWSEEHTSNQVKLVENLQFMEFRNVLKGRVKVSVVVSCWDLVQKTYKYPPDSWVEKHMPLLHQYLSSNDQIFQCKYFGVSAQGCDYKNDDDVKKLRLVEPFERPIVKEGNNITNDITSPIIWLATDDNKD